MDNAIAWISTNYTAEQMGALTKKRPLTAVPFGGRYRLIDFTLSNIVNGGIRTVGLAIPYYSRSILDHLGAGKEWNLDRKRGGMFLLPGVAFGLKAPDCRFILKDFVRNLPFLEKDRGGEVVVCDGSDVANIDFSAILAEHRRSGAEITLLYKEYEETPAESDNAIFLRLAENGQVAAMVTVAKEGEPVALFLNDFIVNRELLVGLIAMYRAADYMDLRDIIRENLHIFKVRAYHFKGYFGRIESQKSYFTVNMDLLNPTVYAELFQGKHPVYTKVKDKPPTRYLASAEVNHSIIASGCRIAGKVENSIVFRDVIIEEGALVKNCVVMNGAVVNGGAILENVITDKFVTVNRGLMVRGRAGNPIVFEKKSTI